MVEKSTFLAALILVICGVVIGQKAHDERCQILEGNNVRVDECDGRKLLTCKEGRCQCPDPVNNIYTYREEVVSNSRSRRSPKKGKGSGFKNIAIGAAAGAATYHVASNVASGSGSGIRVGTKAPKQKTEKVWSCYSRVGGQCSLEYNNWESISASTSATVNSTTTTEISTTNNATSEATTTTTSSAANSTDVTGNVTTSTTAAPSTTSAPGQVDFSKMPKCVQNAVCQRSTSSNATGVLQKVAFDPRIGTCECATGYTRTAKDLCVKARNGAEKTVGISTTVILATLLFNKIFVL